MVGLLDDDRSNLFERGCLESNECHVIRKGFTASTGSPYHLMDITSQQATSRFKPFAGYPSKIQLHAC